MTFREQLEQIGEHRAHIKNAKKMLAEGLDYMLIKEITGLSDAELQAL